MSLRCKHCGERLIVIGRQVGGRLVATKAARHRDRFIQHLKSRHPDIATQYGAFRHTDGFHLAEHIHE